MTSPAACDELPVFSMTLDTWRMASKMVMEPLLSFCVISSLSIPIFCNASLVAFVIRRIFLIPITMAFMFWSVNSPPSEFWMMATSCDASMPASRKLGAYCCIMESSLPPSPCIIPCIPSRSSCIASSPVLPNCVMSVLAALTASRKSTL